MDAGLWKRIQTNIHTATYWWHFEAEWSDLDSSIHKICCCYFSFQLLWNFSYFNRFSLFSFLKNGYCSSGWFFRFAISPFALNLSSFLRFFKDTLHTKLRYAFSYQLFGDHHVKNIILCLSHCVIVGIFNRFNLKKMGTNYIFVTDKIYSWFFTKRSVMCVCVFELVLMLEWFIGPCLVT